MDKYSYVYATRQLLSGFHRLRAEGRMCDVVLEAGGVSFPCHRTLLASSSDYFWALFGDTTAERFAESVSLPVLTAQGLECILDYLYSGWLRVSCSNISVVLEAASYLQVEGAVAVCERFMVGSLSARTCCSYANLAERFVLPTVSEAALRTIALKMETVLRECKDHLLELDVQSLIAVLDSDEISAREVELLQLALDWLDENGPLPLLKSNLLLSRLRFALVSASDLAKFNHRAMSTPLIRGMVTQALEYHQMGLAQPIRQNKQTTLRASPLHVLLVGGRSADGEPERSLLAFDPRSKKFSPVSSRLPRLVRHHCVCSVGGFLFVIGGQEAKEQEGGGDKSVAESTTNQVWRYDPRFNCWQEMPSMLAKRQQFSCCVVDDVIYAIGGRHTDPPDSQCIALASVEFLDMATGAWRKGANMPVPLYGHASTVLHNNIYVSGGRSNDDGGTGRLCFCWDLKGRTWETRASMSISRFSHRLATASGYIYALLGAHEPFSQIERYDSKVDTWARLHPLPLGQIHYGMVVLPPGNLLVLGGSKWKNGEEVVLRSVLEYSTETDSWRQIGKMPKALTEIECTLLPLPV